MANQYKTHIARSSMDLEKFVEANKRMSNELVSCDECVTITKVSNAINVEISIVIGMAISLAAYDSAGMTIKGYGLKYNQSYPRNDVIDIYSRLAGY